jgi:xanthine dehydrogenase accessory factor
MFDRAGLAAALKAHGRVARVVVAEVKGSAPREVGAAMLVWADGQAGGQTGGQSGTIGGGALEYQAAARARDMLAAGVDLRCETVPLGPNLGQCCGGSVRLLTEVFTAVPQPSAVFARPISRQSDPMAANDMPLAVARILARARKGAWDKEGGGMLQASLHQGWFVEPCAADMRPIWIWGAGHVGRALVGVLAPLPDMAITWVDTGFDRFPSDIPLGVRALPCADMPAALHLAPKDAAHVIVTFSHALDLALCAGALRHGFASCGVIGSATKWARFSARLAALGFGAAEISRINCPIGLPDLGKHPQAIAIGVAAMMMGGRAQAHRPVQEAKA